MMYKYKFRKIDPYDWFCGPGSQMGKKGLINMFVKNVSNLDFNDFV